MRKLFLLTAMFLQAGGQPVNVPIQNASFELPTRVSGPTQNCGFGGYEVPEWTGRVFAFKLAASDPCGIATPFPDGQYAGYLVNATMSQDLGSVTSLLPRDANGEINGVYTLKFFVANYFYWYPAFYSSSLSVVGSETLRGQTVLCSTSGLAAGDFAEISLVCPSQRVFGELSVSFSSNGPNENVWPVLIDKISLTFTPTN